MTVSTTARPGSLPGADPGSSQVPEGRRSRRASRNRLKRRSRRTAVVLGAAAAVLLAAATILGFRFLSFGFFGPQAEVKEYLAALTSGNQADALAALPPSQALTPRDPAIYAAAENRITDYEILGQDIFGKEAVVRAELEQNGKRSTVEFALEASGSRFLIFSGWRLQHTAARSVAVTLPAGTGEIRINGRDVQLPADAAGTLEIRLLPGGYRFEGPGSRYLSYGEPHTVLVDPGMTGDPDPVHLFASATAELTADVQAKGEAYLAHCLAQDETAPASCPNAAYAGGDAARYRNVEWKLDRAPRYRIIGTPETGLAVYATGGKAQVNYEEDVTGKGGWEARSDLVNIPFGSNLEVAGETLLLDFQP